MSDRAFGDILRDVVRDVQDLLRSEVRLAKAAVSEQVDRARSAGGLFGGAAVAALFAGMCLLAACIAALAEVLPVWAAALIMTVVLGIAGAMLYRSARARLRKFHAVPPQTVETLRRTWNG